MVSARHSVALASLLICAHAQPSVHLDNGLSVQGQLSSIAPTVAEFLGIPYAQPPVGDLRWAPPQALASNSTKFANATVMPKSCWQNITMEPDMVTYDVPEFSIGSAGMSEDCLTTSIWTPVEALETAENEAGLPVLIWFFGGGFTTGGVDVPYQMPAQWVERSQSHIVVSFNYRINLFGFPNSAALTEQNLGLMDQRLAVEWVQENIAKFGGDPDKMAIWGHSAGSIAVDYYNFAYPEDPIVKGLIMDSGTAHLDQLMSLDTAQSSFSLVAANVGCGNTTDAVAELACMRKVPAETLESFIVNYHFSGATPSLSFSVIADEKLVFSNYTERAEAGAMSDLPAIIGFNAREGVFLATYNTSGLDEATVASLSYSYFWCPSTKTTLERVAANRTTHRFFYNGNFTNVSPRFFEGAYHGSELPMLFGTHANFRGNSTPFQYEVSHTMQDAYLAFISDPVSGLDGVGWPAYEAAGGAVRAYGENGTAATVRSLVDIEDECGALGLL
ncbi:carboxylesterase [Pseudomassariella vexata]|uniref:Carboxylic ester hydrolase n=1 Tax=Pseudomassariella vexata TaxID=1141098 RepID=A0A1Y2EH87_9PEZI|nr:carboxylesterase [Pseudomassariella vexata]ORY70939.1 carboxylesterase [Pseudomassariella vexata]